MHPFLRLFLMFVIWSVATIGWVAFGAIMTNRSETATQELSGKVAELWGRPHQQIAPTIAYVWNENVERVREETDSAGIVRHIRETESVRRSEALRAASTRVTADLALDQRRKGLVWYSLYDVEFHGRWSYRHERAPGWIEFSFPFPDAEGTYDGFALKINGRDVDVDIQPGGRGVQTTVPVEPGAQFEFEVHYKSRGLDSWSYSPTAAWTAPPIDEGSDWDRYAVPAAPGEAARLTDFELVVHTDFADIDFPGSTLSPTSRHETDEGWSLAWTSSDVVTGKGMGVITPQRIQPGELAAELSFSAPIALFFFLLMVQALCMKRDIAIHPINYLFLAAAFFSFHLLFGYVANHLPVIESFALSSIVSIFLVVTYMRLVVSNRFAFVEAALSQLVYLVGFSLAHFWQGFTGLTVVVLSIVTLFCLMQMTGRVRWGRNKTKFIENVDVPANTAA